MTSPFEKSLDPADAAKALRVPIGVASPLWLMFASAASAGVAYWWFSRWRTATNLEAVLEAPAASEPMALAAPVIVEPVVEAAAEPLVVAEPEPVVEAVTEAVAETAEAVAEATPEPVVEPMAAAVEPPVVETIAAPPAVETPVAPTPKAKPKAATAKAAPAPRTAAPAKSGKSKASKTAKA